MNLRFFLKGVLILLSINSAWADPESSIAIIEKDNTPGYIFIIQKIYNRGAPKGYILLPKLLASNHSNLTHAFPIPASFTPYEVKIAGSSITIEHPLEKWPNTAEPGTCIWYVHVNGTFKFIGKSSIHYGTVPQDTYCEPK